MEETYVHTGAIRNKQVQPKKLYAISPSDKVKRKNIDLAGEWISFKINTKDP